MLHLAICVGAGTGETVTDDIILGFFITVFCIHCKQGASGSILYCFNVQGCEMGKMKRKKNTRVKSAYETNSFPYYL